MRNSNFAAALLALALSGAGPPAQTPRPAAPRLEEERIRIEHHATDGETVLLLSAESEETLERVEVRDPGGAPLVRLDAGRGQRLALAGFVFETREPDPAALRASWPEGEYALRGWTADGCVAHGRAVLVHDLPGAPHVLFPADEAEGVETTATVSWEPDPAVSAWRVILEQDENDGLSVELPGRSRSFRVPEGVLRPGRETHLELAAVGPGGNATLVDVVFTTR
jgi:hypothetical protein